MEDPVEGIAASAVRPERFGRYVLLDRIGAGGMAEVFRAVMPGAEGFRRTFVLKRILSQLSQTPTFVDMFVREARICSMLNHPSIVAVYDFGHVDGNYFLAMEYVRGRDLQAVLRKLRRDEFPCPIPIAAYIAREVADCLSYAHELAGADGKPLNIIHRDISPSNIMCLTAGGIKLLDFGIAKVLGDAAPEDRTERGSFKGKFSYMAPERIRREPIDRRSDLFSLGVVLWEMLTARRLFRAGTDYDTMRNVREANVPRPSSLRPEVPPALDAIVMRALERNPDERYPTGRAMVDDLEEVLQETRHQSRLLPDLLRDLYGSGLTSGQFGVEGLEEELAAVADSSTARGTSDSQPPPPAPEKPRWDWRRIGVATFAAGATVALAALLLARGGGGRSHAMGYAEHVHVEPPAALAPVGGASAAVLLKAAPEASGTTTPKAEGAPAEAPSNEAPRAEAVPAEAAPAEDAPAEGASGDEPPARRSTRTRHRSDKNRIARGLSINPFAETPRSRK
jgi:serine/threonine protein kinase